MILDQSTHLQVVMTGSATVSQPEIQIAFIDWTQDGKCTPPLPARAALNHITDVTVLSACAGIAISREVLSMSIFNKDTVSQTIVVKTDDGTTERIEQQQTVGTKRTLAYEKGEGWYQV